MFPRRQVAGNQKLVPAKPVPAKAGSGKPETCARVGGYKKNVIPAEAGIQSFPSFPRRRESRNMKKFYVYILCNKRNGTLYTGVTSDIVKRVYEHKNDLVEGFTKKYNVHHLVWYEIHESAESAIVREKQIKKWKRAWKLKIIEKENPQWIDLYKSICK